MKKRKLLVSIILAAIVCMATALPVSASTLYFTSINNILMPLSDDTMPINVDGIMYVPYSVFNSSELGTYSVYSKTSQVVLVFRSDLQLNFDLKDGSTYDNTSETYSISAVYSNGVVYIPAAFTCEFFGIQYSVIRGNDYGPIIRMKRGDVLDDETFAKAAAALMKSRLNQYKKGTSETAAPTPTPSPTPTPTPGPVTPTPAPNDETQLHTDVDVFINIYGLDPGTTPLILRTLENNAIPATFFLTQEDILENADLVRRILGSGFTVGLVVGEDYKRDYELSSALLYEASHQACFIVAAGGNYGSDYYNKLSADGLILASNYTKLDSIWNYYYGSPLNKKNGSVEIAIPGDSKTADGLTTLILKLKKEEYNIMRHAETASFG